VNVSQFDDSTQRARPEGGARSSAMSARRPTILTWQGDHPPSLESLRLRVSEGRTRASGRMIAAGAEHREAFSASFEAAFDRSETAGRLLLRTATAEEERQVSLSRTEDGVWLVDHGQGAERNAFDGAIDVDVSGAVTFNALPIRRLGLHRQPGEHELPVVYVTLPELSIRLVRQTYRTVSINDTGAVINFSNADTNVDLVVDTDGLAIEFPGLARRV
jgi:hypothetical protein